MAKRDSKPLKERFWAKVDQKDPDDCWLWLASRNNRGYGQFHTRRQENGERRLVLAHRFAYELLVAPIPGDLSLDHLCRNTLCVNPAHLEPVSHQENCRRGIAGQVNAARERAKTHCINGHLFDEANTHWYRSRRSDGVPYRVCRACCRDHARASYKRKKELAKRSS